MPDAPADTDIFTALDEAYDRANAGSYAKATAPFEVFPGAPEPPPLDIRQGETIQEAVARRPYRDVVRGGPGQIVRTRYPQNVDPTKFRTDPVEFAKTAATKLATDDPTTSDADILAIKAWGDRRVAVNKQQTKLHEMSGAPEYSAPEAALVAGTMGAARQVPGVLPLSRLLGSAVGTPDVVKSGLQAAEDAKAQHPVAGGLAEAGGTLVGMAASPVMRAAKPLGPSMRLGAQAATAALGENVGAGRPLGEGVAKAGAEGMAFGTGLGASARVAQFLDTIPAVARSTILTQLTHRAVGGASFAAMDEMLSHPGGAQRLVSVIVGAGLVDVPEAANVRRAAAMWDAAPPPEAPKAMSWESPSRGEMVDALPETGQDAIAATKAKASALAATPVEAPLTLPRAPSERSVSPFTDYGSEDTSDPLMPRQPRPAPSIEAEPGDVSIRTNYAPTEAVPERPYDPLVPKPSDYDPTAGMSDADLERHVNDALAVLAQPTDVSNLSNRTLAGAPIVPPAKKGATGPRTVLDPIYSVGMGPSVGGLSPVKGATNTEALAEETAKKGERGYVAVGAPDLSFAGKVWDKLKGGAVASADWLNARGYPNVERADPETAQIMAEGSTVQTLVKSGGVVGERYIVKGIDENGARVGPSFTKTDQRKFEVLSEEHELRSVGKRKRGVDKWFDRFFPTEADVQSGFADPTMQEMAKRTKTWFRANNEDFNIRGGGLDATEKGKGRQVAQGMGGGEFTDLRTNLVPLSEDDLASAQTGGPAKVSTASSAVRGSLVSQAPVGRALTGEADSYDSSLRGRLSRGTMRAAVTAKRLDALESAVRNGSLKTFDEETADGERERPPKGWSQVRLDLGGDIDIEGKVGPDATPESLKGKSVWAPPETAAEWKRFLGADRVNTATGPLGALTRFSTSAATSGLAEAGVHTVTTLLPTAMRAGRYIPRIFTDATRFLFSEGARESERMKQAEGAYSRPSFDKGPISKWFSPASKALESIDLAIRRARTDAERLAIGKGERPDTFKSVRDAGLEAGQYNALAMDQATRFFRAFFGQFVSGGKAAVAGAYRMPYELIGSPGREMSGSARIKAAARAATVMAGTLMVVGSHNKDETGEYFPKGVPWGSWVTGKNDDGSYSYSWIPLLPTGAGAALGITGIGQAIDDMRTGASPLKVAIDPVVTPAARMARSATQGPPAQLLTALSENMKMLDDPSKTGKFLVKIGSRTLPITRAVEDFVDGKLEEGTEAMFGFDRKSKGKSPQDADR